MGLCRRRRESKGVMVVVMGLRRRRRESKELGLQGSGDETGDCVVDNVMRPETVVDDETTA
jgi:hypothetical protein